MVRLARRGSRTGALATLVLASVAPNRTNSSFGRFDSCGLLGRRRSGRGARAAALESQRSGRATRGASFSGGGGGAREAAQGALRPRGRAAPQGPRPGVGPRRCVPASVAVVQASARWPGWQIGSSANPRGTRSEMIAVGRSHAGPGARAEHGSSARRGESTLRSVIAPRPFVGDPVWARSGRLRHPHS